MKEQSSKRIAREKRTVERMVRWCVCIAEKTKDMIIYVRLVKNC